MSLLSLLYQQRWSEIPNRLKTHPEEAKSWKHIVSDLPLHYASSRNDIPAEVIDTLIEAYPQAVKEKSELVGALPLHVAVREVSSTTLDVLQVLLRHYSKGATIKNNHGHTPLLSHIVLCESPSIDVIKLLVEAHPDAVRITNNYQYYPLHHAVECGDWELSKWLIDAYPEALRKETNARETPRDIAK